MPPNSGIDAAVATHRLTERDKRLLLMAGSASVATATVLVALKGWAWIATDSVALLSSLADSLLDLLASLVTLFAVRFAAEPADREHRFGHGKAEAIAGLVQSLIISASAVYVGVQAVGRLVEPRFVESPGAGIGVMAVSLVFTISLVSFQRLVTRRTGSIAISADAIHYQADILSNVAVLVAIALSAWFDWYLADPLIGLAVVVLILLSVRDIVTSSLDVLLDRELPTEARKEIREIALSHEAVLGVHDLRTRSAGNSLFIQFHLELEPHLTLDDVHGISHDVENQVVERFPTAEVLIHADPYGVPERRDEF
jgi:ferrous-iron efflux pump FieF